MAVSYIIRMRSLVLAVALISLSACSAPSAGGSSSATAASVPSTAETVALAYTSDYMLYSDGEDEEEYPVYGLSDKDKTVILPAKYREISVSEAGLIFTYYQDGENSVCQIRRADGSQIGTDYSWIEYASTDPDGNPGTFSASALGQRPVPPYTASINDPDSRRRCWILDENGQPKETEPYEDIRTWADGSIVAVRDGTQFVFKADGTTETLESEIEATYFDGKYQVKRSYQSAWGGLFYSLLDKDGKEIVPPEYSKIQVPFEDRYVLYEGWTQTIDGAQALLYDDTGKLLADNSNLFGFVSTPDSGYIGVSMIGNVFDGGVWSPESRRIFDDAENPETHGYYFVDRDGKRLGDRYTYIDFFENEAAEHAGLFYTTSPGNPAAQGSIRGVVLDTPVADAYFRVIKQDGSMVTIPLAEKLIK